jgi:hypothetical protein
VRKKQRERSNVIDQERIKRKIFLE